jgi:hypothetical protein
MHVTTGIWCRSKSGKEKMGFRRSRRPCGKSGALRFGFPLLIPGLRAGWVGTVGHGGTILETMGKAMHAPKS